MCFIFFVVLPFPSLRLCLVFSLLRRLFVHAHLTSGRPWTDLGTTPGTKPSGVARRLCLNELERPFFLSLHDLARHSNDLEGPSFVSLNDLARYLGDLDPLLKKRYRFSRSRALRCLFVAFA